MRSILVIGGGLVGAASALRLQKAGIRATLIDPGDKRRGASFGNAGHLGSEQVLPWSTWANLAGAASHLFGLGGPLDFRWRDIGLWLPWSLRFMAASDPKRVAASQAALTAILAQTIPAWTRLVEFAGAPDLVQPHGQYNVYMEASAGDRAREIWSRTPIGTASYRDMTEAELAHYDGVLKTRPASGLVFSGTGQVRDPQGARDAILAEFVRSGGEIVSDTASRVTDQAHVTLASGATRGADTVLIAAGAWSKPLMQMLGAAAPLIGERGYSMQSVEHAWPEGLPTTIFEERSVVLSRFTSGLRATSFLEFGDPSAAPDPRKWARLQAHVADLGVKFSAAPDRWVGPRPTLPDYVPAIGRLESAPRVLYAFGHAHLGLTMSAMTSELVEAIATDNAPSIDLKPFRIERFG